jgi:hypothetical protein
VTSPQDAWSDKNDLRWYTFQKRDYLSVTSLRKVLGMPYNLHRWSMKQLLDVVMANPAVLDRGEKKGKPETDANIRGRVGRLSMESRDVSAERGTAVHEAISEGIPMADLDLELQPFMESYASAVIALGISPILTEQQVFNDTYGYAGSFDLFASVRAKAGKKTVIDLKTGKGTYSDHALQGMAYLMGEFIGADNKVLHPETAAFKEASGVAILHLHPGVGAGWTYHDVDISVRLIQAFKAEAVLARWMVDFPTIETLEVVVRSSRQEVK